MTEQNKIKRFMEALRQYLKEADDHAMPIDNYKYTRWVKGVEGILANQFGENSRQLKNFKDSLDQEMFVTSYGEDGLAQYRQRQIPNAKGTLEAILSEEETFGFYTERKPTTLPTIFIAHGGKTTFLTKLQNFFKALGVIPLIAEDEPSEGRSVDQQVEWCLNNADCALILGTADDKDLKDGKLYPRRNVHIEIGRIQERFPNRVIYLIQAGASFPSNINEKVYERFTQSSMEMAFQKIVKELRAFGVIRTESIRKQSD
jgi:predicted nucleotide-binding protein